MCTATTLLSAQSHLWQVCALCRLWQAALWQNQVCVHFPLEAVLVECHRVEVGRGRDAPRKSPRPAAPVLMLQPSLLWLQTQVWNGLMRD